MNGVKHLRCRTILFAQGANMTPSVEYRLIPLTKGQWAIVDVADYNWLMQWKWHAIWNARSRTFYAVRKLPRQIGMPRMHVQMHRQILGLERGDKRQGDHEDHNGLNNRRYNLRIATPSQNQENKDKPRNNTSGYKGVAWLKSHSKWRARITHDGSKIFLGYFDTAEEAYAAYCAAAKLYHGEFARIA